MIGAQPAMTMKCTLFYLTFVATDNDFAKVEAEID